MDIDLTTVTPLEELPELVFAPSTHPDLASHEALGLAGESEVAADVAALQVADSAEAAARTAHGAATTAVHGIVDTSQLVTVAAMNAAISSAVATAVANLVNSSPSTLDTLKELADALGDDPNFATTMTTALAGKVSVTGGGKETVQTIAASGAAQTLNLAAGNVVDLTLTANCTLTFSGATAGKSCGFTLVLRQDATGGRAVTWPASVHWPGGTAPTLTTTSSKRATLSFVSIDGGTNWDGYLVGDAIS